MTEGPSVGELLDERPDLEPALEAVVDVDEDLTDWTFDDVDVDSGAFGELVSANVVRQTDEGYEVADPDAVRQALAGERPDESESEGTPIAERLPSVDIDGLLTHKGPVLLAVALVAVVVARVYAYPEVFRDGHVVLMGNDPYHYRYWVEQIATGRVDLLSLPGRLANGEPLLYVTLALVTMLAGGPEVGGAVLAVYPVVAAALVAFGIYVLGRELGKDWRVGVAAVALYAFVPLSTFRTTIGFADHHAFDYVWLILTATALVLLPRPSGTMGDWSRRTWGVTVLLALGVAGQYLAWETAPLLVLPIALVVALEWYRDTAAERSTRRRLAPLVVALAGAVLVVSVFHLGLGWHGRSLWLSALALLGGTALLAWSGDAVPWTEEPWATRRFLLVRYGTLTAIVLVGILYLLRPGRFSTLFDASQITEAKSLATRTDKLPALLPIGILGLLGARAMGRTVRDWSRAEMVVASYGITFLGLALVQSRFVGEFAPFLAVIGGLGLRTGLRWIGARDLLGELPGGRVDGPRPDKRMAVLGLVVLLLVATPGAMATSSTVDELAIDQDRYETAIWMGEYAEANGWDQPDRTIAFSPWPRNRLFNYFAGGDANSYGFSQRHYIEFLGSEDPAAWYSQLEGNVSLILTQDGVQAQEWTTYARLHHGLGAPYEEQRGLGHYRLVYSQPDDSYRVFEVVPGATVSGTLAPGQIVAMETDVEVPGEQFTYRRFARANESGEFATTLAQPGTYTVMTDNGTANVTVSEAAVQEGETIRVRDELEG